MSKVPEKLGAGQLSADYDGIQAILTGRRDAFEYDLVPFAALLRAIGEGRGDKETKISYPFPFEIFPQPDDLKDWPKSNW